MKNTTITCDRCSQELLEDNQHQSGHPDIFATQASHDVWQSVNGRKKIMISVSGNDADNTELCNKCIVHCVQESFRFPGDSYA